jgi:hypothetical protein
LLPANPSRTAEAVPGENLAKFRIGGNTTTTTFWEGKLNAQPMKDFTISINQDSVEVRLDPSSRSSHAKLRGAVYITCLSIVGSCVLLFLPGKDSSPNMWHDMSNANVESGSFLVPLGLLIGFCGLVMWMGFRWSAARWPSDETLRCDHIALTISRIPYLDFHNSNWKTKSFALRDIEQFRFDIYASAKRSSIYGFRFRVNGRRHKTLPGLEAPEAQDILKALQRLGIDVVLDDWLQIRVAEALRRRGGPISLSV